MKNTESLKKRIVDSASKKHKHVDGYVYIGGGFSPGLSSKYDILISDIFSEGEMCKRMNCSLTNGWHGTNQDVDYYITEQFAKKHGLMDKSLDVVIRDAMALLNQWVDGKVLVCSDGVRYGYHQANSNPIVSIKTIRERGFSSSLVDEWFDTHPKHDVCVVLRIGIYTLPFSYAMKIIDPYKKVLLNTGHAEVYEDHAKIGEVTLTKSEVQTILNTMNLH